GFARVDWAHGRDLVCVQAEFDPKPRFLSNRVFVSFDCNGSAITYSQVKSAAIFLQDNPRTRERKSTAQKPWFWVEFGGFGAGVWR
ncbi:MAG: hypothetical protein Q4D27_04815, partial [Coriobacteriia bacterium]|nr:hypothetical protein [Coriobacteriia bacterium]